jgi:hypothetical protein
MFFSLTFTRSCRANCMSDSVKVNGEGVIYFIVIAGNHWQIFTGQRVS